MMSRPGDYAKYSKDPVWLLRKTMVGRSKRVNQDVEELLVLLEAQGWHCAICGQTLTLGKRGMHLDHDHATGDGRAFLCASCNVGLGQFGDSPERLEAAAAYLRNGG